MNQQIQIPLGRLPIHLVCLDNGYVVFVRIAHFPPLLELLEDNKVAAYFFEDEIKFFNTMSDEMYRYNTMYNYKELPLMKQWIIQQELEMPVFM